MIVYDSGQFFWSWDVQVIGMDVDGVALDKARRAVYHHNSFRSLSPAVKERHFVPVAAGAAQVKDPIRRLVTFRSGNIVDPASFAGLPPLDVIFCRNVLIYFSDAMILKVVRLFHDALAPGRVPVPRPRRVALAHHRPLHADPLPGRDGLPQGGHAAARALPAAAP